MDTKELIKRVGALHVAGNIIPGSWYHHILGNGSKKNKKPDLVAITILADILYWYRPGKKGNKKFNGDMLQTQIAYYEEKFHFGESQIKAGLAKLRELNLIRSKTQVVYNDQKGCCQTLLFVEPVIDELERITHEEISSPREEESLGLGAEKTSPRDTDCSCDLADKPEGQEEISFPPEEISVPLKEISAPSLGEEISAPNIRVKNIIKTLYKEEPEEEINLVPIDITLHDGLGAWKMAYDGAYKLGVIYPKVMLNEADIPSIIENLNLLWGSHRKKAVTDMRSYVNQQKELKQEPNLLECLELTLQEVVLN